MKFLISLLGLFVLTSSAWADDYQSVLIKRGRLIVRLRQINQMMAADSKHPLAREFDQGVVELHRLNLLQRELANTIDDRTRNQLQISLKNYFHFSLPMIERGDRVLSPGRVDLSGQFGETRDQGLIGTCSIFAGTALLEAALFREMGKKYDLSEMWLLRDRVHSLARFGWSHYGNGKFWLGMNPEYLLSRVQEIGICRDKNYEYDVDYVHLRSLEIPAEDLQRQLGTQYLGLYLPERNAYLRRNFKEETDEFLECKSNASVFKDLSLDLRFQELKSPTEEELASLVEMGIPAYLSLEYSPTSAHAVVATGYDRNKQALMIRSSSAWLVSGETEIRLYDDSSKVTYAALYLTHHDRMRICFESKLLPPRVAAICQ